MSDFIPKVLIFGHSFVRRLHDDLVKGFDSRAKQNFNLAGSGVYVCLKGTGGHTVEKVRKYDISAIASIQPDIIILVLGTNVHQASCIKHLTVQTCISKLRLSGVCYLKFQSLFCTKYGC